VLVTLLCRERAQADESACREWDVAEEARRLVEAEGVVVEDRFGQPKTHPAVGIERKARSAFRLLVRELGLDHASPGESRGPAVPENAHLRAI